MLRIYGSAGSLRGLGNLGGWGLSVLTADQFAELILHFSKPSPLQLKLLESSQPASCSTKNQRVGDRPPQNFAQIPLARNWTSQIISKESADFGWIFSIHEIKLTPCQRRVLRRSPVTFGI
jgi:hypothetical protein